MKKYSCFCRRASRVSFKRRELHKCDFGAKLEERNKTIILPRGKLEETVEMEEKMAVMEVTQQEATPLSSQEVKV